MKAKCVFKYIWAGRGYFTNAWTDSDFQQSAYRKDTQAELANQFSGSIPSTGGQHYEMNHIRKFDGTLIGKL